MHGLPRERLESLLGAKPSHAASDAVNHISGCPECATEVTAMRAQAELIRSLRVTDELEPSAGFYARVMQRIELGAKRSIWWVFVYSPVGKRLAYGSLTVALALGSYVIAAEEFDGHLSSQVDQRQAVLANFIAHPRPSQQ